MAKKYNIWVHVEEHDTDTDEHKDLMESGEMETIFMGVVKTQKQIETLSSFLCRGRG